MSWLVRAFFLLVAGAALAGLIGSAACTRRGKSSPLPPTSSPLTTIDVNPKTGSDTTGNGTPDKPYKTLTKAIAVVKSSTTTGLTIQLSVGTYDAANGEVFPIVIPTSVSIAGTGYGTRSFRTSGSFINGAGEDTAYEKLLGRPNSRKDFATIEVAQGVTSGASVSGVYVGADRLGLPAGGAYAAADTLGSLVASRVTFAAGTPLSHPAVAGLLVAGGSLNCTACTILGSDYALLALTPPNGTAPSIVLTGQPTQSLIGGTIGIDTDGSASIDASYQTFQSRRYGYRDAVAPIVSPVPLAGVVDFGHGPTQSAGGNIFIGAASMLSEISVTVAQTLVYAFGDTWNPHTQGTNAQGLYPKARTFRPGDSGRNVTIAPNAAGAAVRVGPIPPPTPTPAPSPTPSGGPTPTPTPT